VKDEDEKKMSLFGDRIASSQELISNEECEERAAFTTSPSAKIVTASKRESMVEAG
jgi:hypothetical protein